MKPWKEVKECITYDKFSNVDSKLTNPEYIDFMESLIEYIKNGLKSIGAKYLKHNFNEYRLAVLIEYKNKLYVLEHANWYTGYDISICENEAVFDTNRSLWFSGKHTSGSFNYDDPELILKGVKFPNHAKYQVGDTVRIQSKSNYIYYGCGNNGKLAKITGITYNANSIDYVVQILKKSKTLNDTTSVYSESSLRRIKGGV